MPSTSPRTMLVLGGVRSGKSDYAEQLALELAGANRRAVYVATAQNVDTAMAERIAKHQSCRSDRFTTIEIPLDLALAIASHGADDVLLIDSVGVWLTNHMVMGTDLDAVTATTVAALKAATCTVILVSDETGLGIMPDNTMAREFADHIGQLNRTIADLADTVVFIVAGLPMMLKSAAQKQQLG